MKRHNSYRVPASTYRIQFNRSFTFAQAREIVDYLHDLGISDVYSSPIFPAGPESTHGYDVCAFDGINPNLGGREEFNRFAGDLKAKGMGLLLDIVPNHMGSHCSNRFWRDVLKQGPSSEFANFFDIDWHPPTPELSEKVLLPVLGDHYGRVLLRGELKLQLEGGQLQLAYFDRKFPLCPKSEVTLRDERKWRGSSADHGPDAVLAEILAEYNEDKVRLHGIIHQQHYRLAFWRVGPHELNYRRFFDVTDLVAVRVEDESVFRQTHELIFELVRNGQVTGLRVDHPDGLRNPKGYFDQLQQHGEIFVVAEKILTGDERLPDDWQVAGTTGYDFLIHLNGLFVNGANENSLSEIHREFTGPAEVYEDVVYESKREILQQFFLTEVNALAGRLKHIAAQTIDGIDFTRHQLNEAIVEFVAAFSVYRTYVCQDRTVPNSVEAEQVEQAVESATARAPKVREELSFLGRVLLIEPSISPAMEFVSRFQQLTGPATAKGVEDTAFYRSTRLASLNEVGGNPGKFGVTLQEFHEHNRHKAERWPHAQLATATHDTKRGEDLRARLNVLSELPDEWREALSRWRVITGQFKTRPSRNDEYLLYQTLLGSWTVEAESDAKTYLDRIQNYMVKAAREAKRETSWTDPNPAYENSLKDFAAQVLATEDWLDVFWPLQRRLAFFGVFNSLSQLILKTFSPGVPDFYQGTEFWDFSLVDPDNRRPVNYKARREMLTKVKNSRPEDLLNVPESGAIKQWVTWGGVNYRRNNRGFFEKADYRPLPVSGSRSEHVVAFERNYEGRKLIVLAPRLVATLLHGREIVPTGHEVWEGTEIPVSGTFRNVLTGMETKGARMGDILNVLPFAALETTEA